LPVLKMRAEQRSWFAGALVAANEGIAGTPSGIR
jgi:hypothetical protein